MLHLFSLRLHSEQGPMCPLRLGLVSSRSGFIGIQKMVGPLRGVRFLLRLHSVLFALKLCAKRTLRHGTKKQRVRAFFLSSRRRRDERKKARTLCFCGSGRQWTDSETRTLRLQELQAFVGGCSPWKSRNPWKNVCPGRL